jgi:predicted RNA binding protein YcfA (HicA-like mRNA interferase family)
MTETPVVTARQLVRVLRKLEFVQTRSRGSHRRFEHPDGRKTTVPVHRGRDIPRGLLRQIATIDVGITIDEFIALL